MLPVELQGSEVRTLENRTTGGLLSVIAARGLVFSCWRFTADELRGIQEGKPVWVVIRGESIPEYNLTVGNRGEVVPAEVIRKARQTEAVLHSPEVEARRAATGRKDLLVELVAWVYAACLLGLVALVVGLLWRRHGW